MILAVPVLWLVLGGLLSAVAVGRWSVAAMAWLAPLCLLHYARMVGLPEGMAGIGLALFLALAVSYRGVAPLKGAVYLGFMAGMAGLGLLPYLADRLLAPRLPGFVSTLVFPLAWTSLEFLGSRANPFGTWGSLAYSQYGNLSLMQLASVTGIWGITFLITWFGAVANWVWECQFAWETVGPGLTVFLSLLGLVVLFGGMRLALTPMPAASVRVAGIGWPDTIMGMEQMGRVFAPSWPDAERSAQRATYRRLQDYFLASAGREAGAGAGIILTPEASVVALREEEFELLARASQLARDEGVYLLLGMAVIRLGDARPVENKAVLIEPSGAPRFAYVKASAVPGLEARTNVRGEWKIPTAETPLGRLAAAICFDLDFPPYLRQAGQAGADLLLVPASDWKEIAVLHHVPAVFRAIESGASMVRVARWGMSAAVDPLGRPLAMMDHFAVKDRVMVAQVPAGGVRTIYSRIGDTFAWLCLVALAALLYHALRSPAPG